MSTLDAALRRIRAAPDGPQIGAFFDYDGTLIDGYSVAAYFLDRIRRGDMSAAELIETLRLTRKADYSDAEFADLIDRGMLEWAGHSEQELRDLWQRLFYDWIAGTMFPEGWQLVRAHQRKGHTVAVASSATPYQIEPLAREYGIEHLLCTRARVRNGRLTGLVEGTPLWGAGKAAGVRRFAAERGIALEASFGYANGNEDIDFLQAVGHPSAVQPRAQLEAQAQADGWPILRFPRRRLPPARAVARTVAAYGALGLTFLAGLAYHRLSGDRRRTVDFVAGAASAAALAVPGVRIAVSGERHLHAHRPCVFILNHQSTFDLLVMMHLIRRGFTGVTKVETRRLPGLGYFMELAGVAFLDRRHARKAVAALKPMVERLRSGLSVCVAPEGTRSWTPRVGPFKHGPFYLAMQAGVPIVPVVIRNAGEIMGRNDQTMRAGTVQVAVLPPIDVSGWTATTMSAHIEAVRRRFEDTLENWPDADDPESAPEPPPPAAAPRRGGKRKPASPRRPRLKPRGPRPATVGSGSD